VVSEVNFKYRKPKEASKLFGKDLNNSKPYL
jgi:hypothetical protein